MKRTVLDTNIIISSALGGALVLILERWDKGEFTVDDHLLELREFRSIPILSGREFMDWLQESKD